MKPNKAQILAKRMERVEYTAAELMFRAEQWTVTGPTLWDLQVRRRELLAAGRNYARAVNALTRPL
jgi:hypothetical protein